MSGKRDKEINANKEGGGEWVVRMEEEWREGRKRNGNGNAGNKYSKDGMKTD